jgi:hypothetical protein
MSRTALIILLVPGVVWAIVFAISMLRARRGARAIRSILWRDRGLCPACGYDLTANVSGTCPECGAATAAEGANG